MYAPRTLIILLLFSIGSFAKGQSLLRTIAPTEKVILGESFQVQFLIGAETNDFTYNTPSFEGFRVVAGPSIYSGTLTEKGVLKKFENLVFTLAPLQKGRLNIRGMAFNYKGKIVYAPNAEVQVITKQEAEESMRAAHGYDSEYFLRAGEDPYEKIRTNIFLRVALSKRHCVVGEPITATFKLYSRLQSRSDIARNPGFYGFGVYDAVSVQDHIQETEVLNGRVFDVHTIRKVHLYPQQSGIFIIDAMELNNEVEFSRTVVNRKTEQEISENMYGPKEDRKPSEGAEVYKSVLRSEPVTIRVDPLPTKNVPNEFAGAVGDFKIRSYLSKNEIEKDGQANLFIEISGKGNFTQISAPRVNWPASVEGYEAVANESLDKKLAPASGSKTFKYSFVALQPGRTELPGIEFSFYDLNKKQYKTVFTDKLDITINKSSGKRSDSKDEVQASETGGVWFIAASALLLATIISLLFYRSKQKKESGSKPTLSVHTEKSISDFLNAALTFTAGDPVSFYTELNKGIWKYFGEKLELKGGNSSKLELRQKMKESGISDEVISATTELIEQFELATYTGVLPKESQDQSYKKAFTLLERVDKLIK